MIPEGIVRELTARLESLALADGLQQAPGQTADAAVDQALARIAALTDLLRRNAVFDDATRLAARLLLTDLAAVSAAFRAHANQFEQLLADALAEQHG